MNLSEGDFTYINNGIQNSSYCW